jgi:hypothetical protein
VPRTRNAAAAVYPSAQTRPAHTHLHKGLDPHARAKLLPMLLHHAAHPADAGDSVELPFGPPGACMVWDALLLQLLGCWVLRLQLRV